MHSTSLFTNPYAVEVLRTKREELIEGINDPDHLLSCLIDNDIFSPEKRMVMSFYRTRTEKNSRVLDILISQGERACRLFFYPCLKQVEPKLYNKMRKYVSEVNESIRDFVTPLHTASQRGNADVAKQLLHHKANVNAKDKQSKSPLHFACERGDKTMVEMLLNANADPNAQDKEKKTPLHAAALRGHLGIVQVLLAKKGRPGLKDMDGCTPAGHLNAVNSLINWSQGEKANLLYQAAPYLDISVRYPVAWH
uniref:CARD domain-containing protein n=1 Tax=Meleagris gallopavo TaxID=9103 RepID=A0A803Y3Z7_MELGA